MSTRGRPSGPRGALTFLLLLPAAACAPGAGIAPADYSPNLLLITVDTLRPDALGWIGGRNTTPVLDGLAAGGFGFPAAVTPVPITLPAHVSLMSGRIPPHHGVRDNGQMLGREIATLAERLAGAGYTTGAFVSGFPLQAMFGLDRGFGHYDDEMPHGPEGWVERRSPETTAAALGWVAERQEPWFGWVHYYDPHEPYEPPRTFWKPGARGAYDGEVEFTDHAIGALLDGIPAAVRARTLVVFAADHGEALGEHGERTHGYYIYDTTASVPLVFHHAGRVPPGRSDAPARLVDVAPTILELLDQPPLEGADGVSLVPTLLGRPQRLPAAWIETQLPWRYFGWAPLSGVRLDDWKYIEAPRPELYDVASDPEESDNVVALETERAAWLRDELAALARVGEASAVVVDDPEVIEKLRALGYVGAGAAVEAPPEGLPDPKDRIEQRETLREAELLLRSGRLSEALGLYEQVLTVEPGNRAATLRSGIARLKGGDLAGAVERLTRAIELDPERAEARYALADALTRSGDLARGSEQWMEVVRLQPRRAEGWANLGTTLLSQGRAAEAAEAYATAHDLRPDDVRLAADLGHAWLAAAGAAAAGGHEAEARAALDRALAVTPELRAAAAADPRLARFLAGGD